MERRRLLDAVLRTVVNRSKQQNKIKKKTTKTGFLAIGYFECTP